MGLIIDWLSVAGDLLLGACCPGCEQPGVGLCDRCRARLERLDPRPATPDPTPPGFPDTVTAGPYDDLMHRLIPAHKERQVWLLTGVLADQLARAVVGLLDGRAITATEVLLVPVPSAPAAVRARGRDATLAIARGAARRLRRRTGYRVTVVSLLRPTRRLADQSRLTADERRRNLAGAYAVRAGRRPHRAVMVVVVDDLVTTGSSLTEAARAMAAAGIPVTGAAVIAAAVRRGGRRPAAPVGTPTRPATVSGSRQVGAPDD